MIIAGLAAHSAVCRIKKVSYHVRTYYYTTMITSFRTQAGHIIGTVPQPQACKGLGKRDSFSPVW